MEETLKLLIYEHVSAGGFIDGLISPSILSEGFGMLKTLTSDFKSAGHHVSALLDSRLARLNAPLNADYIVPVSSSQDTEMAMQKMASSVDAAYVIAPESGQVLQSLGETVARSGTASLNCPASIIEKVVDKAALAESLRKLGIATPETITFNVRDDVESVKRTIRDRLGYPVVIKPLNGVGCCGVSLVRNEREVASAVAKVIRESSSERFLAQELVRRRCCQCQLNLYGRSSFSREFEQAGYHH